MAGRYTRHTPETALQFVEGIAKLLVEKYRYSPAKLRDHITIIEVAKAIRSRIAKQRKKGQ